MRNPTRRLVTLVLAVLPLAAAAQGIYPDKPIKLVLNGVEQQVLLPRSIDDLLSLIARGTSDPGKLYVAKGRFDLP